MTRDATATLTAIVERAEADLSCVAELREEGDALAIDVIDHDADIAFRWRLCVVRAVIQNPPDGDAVRELYGELVDRYRDDAERLALLRPIGDVIRKLEADGTLPSAMVARSRRKR